MKRVLLFNQFTPTMSKLKMKSKLVFWSSQSSSKKKCVVKLKAAQFDLEALVYSLYFCSFCYACYNFRLVGQEKVESKEATQERSFYERWVPLSIRKIMVWIILVANILWALTANTVLSLYDVISDYILAYQHFK